jgi:carbon-monoxide dehydrogenase medium subunit
MIPVSFDYARPSTVEEAIAALGSAEEGKILAGGQSLLPVLRLRLAAPTVLVDLGAVPGLGGVRLDGGELVIGAMTTHAEVAASGLVREHAPLLAAAAATVGDRQVRHRGTLGGSLAHADPASDLPAAVLALGGTVVLRGPRGERRVPLTGFYTGVFSSVKEPDELVVEVRVPRTGAAGWAYEKFTRRANDWAIVAVAVVDGRVGLVNMGPTPLRASATEAALAGGASIEEAAALADEGTDPPADLAGTKEYRRHLARVLSRRALTTAAH